MKATKVELTIAGEVSLDPATWTDLGLGAASTRTVLSVTVRDQAALYGLLQRLAALGLELVGLRTSTDSRDVEIVVDGHVGAVLRSALRGVDRATPAATAGGRLTGRDPAGLFADLVRAATLPPEGEADDAEAGQGEVAAAGRESGLERWEDPMAALDDTVDEMGPIDWIVIEFPENRLDGTAFPLLLDLVDRGTIRVLDLAFLAKNADGQVAGVAIHDLDVSGDFDLAILDGASSGLIGDDDLREAGAALSPGAAAGLLVYENTWAAPFATALRRGGAAVVASGRIPVPSIVAALDTLDGMPSPGTWPFPRVQDA